MSACTISITRLDNCVVVEVNRCKEVFGTEPAGTYPESPEARVANSVCKLLNRVKRSEWGDVPVEPTAEAIPAERHGNYSRIVVSLEHDVMTLLAWPDINPLAAAELREAYKSVDAVRRRLNILLPVSHTAVEAKTVSVCVDDGRGLNMKVSEASSAFVVVRDKSGMLSYFEFGRIDPVLTKIANLILEHKND